MPADVIVAGAGIIGATIAWRLAQRGLQVELFDAGGFGGEASSAGAGMLAPGSEICARGPWTELALESHAAYPGFVGELSEESGLPIDYRRCGAVELAFDGGEMEALRARAAKQAFLGIEAEEWNPGEFGGGKAVGALYYPNDALVTPRDILAALQQVLARSEVRLHERCGVREIRAAGRGVEAITGRGRVEGRAAVLAAGAWASGIAVTVDGSPYSPPAAIPIRGHLVGWRLKPGFLGPLLRHHHTYLLQRGSGLLIGGSSEEHAGFDRTVDAGTAEGIAARARHLLPELPASAPEEAWIGFRPGTSSGEPAIGRLGQTALWLAYGHFRNGILMAPATGERIASGIAAS